MRIRVIEKLDTLSPAVWNALVEDDNPFLRHEFLVALERHGCVGEGTSWHPRHLLAEDEHGQVLGALPLYQKDDSFGEFVFDWSWADAYRQHRVPYYPKLVCAVPFTPATGQRLIVRGKDRERVSRALIDATQELALAEDCSSMHCLFGSETDIQQFSAAGFMVRLGCHFHWSNHAYADFAAFTSDLTAKKRKNINRERRLVRDAQVQIEQIDGGAVSEAQWRMFHRFYSNTFYERGRYPPLSVEFFIEIGATMGRSILLVMAYHEGRPVAGAISFRSASALFGRHWGCEKAFDSLHFECCFYQGIEYCIEHGLTRFEPGVQGEHKIWRGFLPTITRSAHWLAHPAFASAIDDYLRREAQAIEHYRRDLMAHSPFKTNPTECPER